MIRHTDRKMTLEARIERLEKLLKCEDANNQFFTEQGTNKFFKDLDDAFTHCQPMCNSDYTFNIEKLNDNAVLIWIESRRGNKLDVCKVIYYPEDDIVYVSGLGDYTYNFKKDCKDCDQAAKAIHTLIKKERSGNKIR